MLSVDLSRAAVLCCDFQKPIFGMFGDAVGVLPPAQALLAQAREAHRPIIYVVLGFRPGYPELSPRSVNHAMITKSGGFLEPTGGDIVAPVHPEPGDVVVAKHRVGAFTGTELDQLLRAKQIDTLVLFGVATSGVVLSTLRVAADLDYRVVVVADACADRDPEVHRVLLEKVFPRQAVVTTSAEVIETLAKLGAERA